MSDFFNIGLPKWPAHVVVGQDVTPEQAAEILIRTDGWWLATNDKAWERKVAELAGIEMGEYSLDWKSTEAFKQRHGVLDLEYLTNSQIASSFIGGPTGWCSWEGHIGSNGTNIGKWPDVETVYNEWTRIAEAFPFLNLRSQLFSGEACQAGERGVGPVIEFVIEGGTVRMSEPVCPLEAEPRDIKADVLGLRTPGRERGVSPEKLAWALGLAQGKRATLA